MAELADLLSCCTPLVRPQLDEEAAVELERLFQALADRNRLKVVNMLAQAEGEAICVCEFQDALGLKQPTVSYHLKQLIDAGVITREQHGRFAYYSLQPGALDRIADLVRPAVPAAAPSSSALPPARTPHAPPAPTRRSTCTPRWST
jgi:ArsR family transcriptional regulator, arsenate/arsenite/antimonite-responsive transcriptional repressor